MAELRLQNVRKAFGSAVILRDLTLTVNPGEFFTFVGPSGCGKSTILNLIAGLEPATGGTILFDGKPIDGMSPAERDVAMIFQNYALYPHLTVYENIAFPLRMRKEGPSRIDGEVRRVAEMLGLGEYLRHRPKELSGGQRQRVALGRAIVRRPKIFLMDEPLSNLDAKLRLDMRTELKNLHRQLGVMTVYVTHDQGEAMGLSDRIAVLEKGELQQCAAPREVYLRPANTFVAGFIGSPAMNIQSCPVTGERPLTVDCNGMLLSLPEVVAPGARRLLIGIRPEDARITAVGTEGCSPVTVSVIEPEGAVNWVNVLWGGRMFRGISDPDDGISPGDQAFLSILREKISVFDDGTGIRLER